jgi:hypothetical protein
MTELNELDLAAIEKIQELKNTTPANAKQIYRKHANKLPNPDIENRADLILAAIERGAEVASDEEVEESVTKPRMTRNERRLAKREAKEAKAKAKKESKPKAAKKSNGEKAPRKKAASVPRVEFPLAKLEREVELTPIPEERSLYTGLLFGKKTVTVWVERNRSTGADARYQSVNVSEAQLEAAKKYAKANDMPVAVCCSVRVLGKMDQGYAIPLDTFNKQKAGACSFNLSGAARKAYSEDGWDGVKFSEKKVEEKAA